MNGATEKDRDDAFGGDAVARERERASKPREGTQPVVERQVGVYIN